MLDKVRSWYLRRKAIHALKRQYRYLIEVDRLMELYVTKQILASKGGAKDQWRQSLIKHQQSIQSQEDLVEFLNSQ